MSRMDNPETPTTLGTQDTNEAKKKKAHRKLERRAIWTPRNPGMNLGVCEG